MKITIDISPEEFKQLIGADKVEQMWMDSWEMMVKGCMDKMWGGFNREDGDGSHYD
jgi:hypothetical protein